VSPTATLTILRALDGAASLLRGSGNGRAEHLETGARGEEHAYFHLRGLGYIMVARNWRSNRRRGEIDLIGWDKETLVFIEVKTRTARDMAPAEIQVDSEKKHELRRMAKEYLLRLKVDPPIRFDIMSVYLLPGKKPELEHFKNAFALSNR